MLRILLLIAAFGILNPTLYSKNPNREHFTVYNSSGEKILLDNENALLYIGRFLHIAISEMDRSGIPASIKLAQGILESGSGMSALAKHAHNHFGIKCGGSWKGKTYYLWDDDVEKSCFRVFDKDEDSYIAHSEFIANPYKSSRYGFLFRLPKTDYKSWANGLQKAGYATSTTYAKSLISIIERYQLYKYDHLTFKTELVAAGETDSIFNVVVETIVIPTDTTFEEPHYVLIPDPFGNIKDSVRIILTKSIFEINEIDAVYVQVGDNLETIAKRYSLSTKKLKRFNELKKSQTLRTGQYIFLEPKKKRYTGSEAFHIVREGQPLFDIAQHYGIRRNELLGMNSVYRYIEPSPGTQIRLKKESKK
jgi:LysM repeat protein